MRLLQWALLFLTVSVGCRAASLYEIDSFGNFVLDSFGSQILISTNAPHVVVGPLQSQNNLLEIATAGSTAQSIARMNLGISGGAGLVGGPMSSTNGFVPTWNGTTGTALSAGFSMGSPPAFGNVIPNVGGFTTLSASGISSLGGGVGIGTANLFNSKFVILGVPPVTTSLVPRAMLVESGFTGTNTQTGPQGWNNIGIPNDTASMSGSQSGLIDLTINHNFGGTGFIGSRVGLAVTYLQIGAIPFNSSNGFGTLGVQSNATVNASWGGTDLHSHSAGGGFGFNSQIGLTGSFSNGEGVSDYEADFSATAGATYQAHSGILVVHGAANAQAAAVHDVALIAVDQIGAAPTASATVQVGTRQAQWPLASTGAFIRAELGVNSNTNPSTAAFGADLLLGTWGTDAIRGNGFAVGGTGTTRIGATYLTPSSSGLDISASGSIGAFSAIASGGSSFPIDGNQYYATDPYDGVWMLVINGSGVVTGVTLYRAPYVNGATPSNPIALTPDKWAATTGATGLTINVTWTAAPTLSLNGDGGGQVTVGGTLQAAFASFASGATFNPNASNTLLGGSTNVFEPIMTSPAHTAGVFSIPVINSLNDTSFYPSAFQMKWYAPDQTSPVPAGTKGQLSGFECTIDSAQTTSDQNGDSGHCFGGTIYVRGGARFDGIDINPQILTAAATVVGVHVGMDIGISGGSQFGFQATSIGSFVGSAAFYADPGGGGGWAADFLGGQTASALSGERSTFRGFSGFGDSSQVNPYVIIGNAGGSGVVGTSNAFSWGLLYNNTRVAIIGPDLVFNSGAPLPSLGVTSGFVHIPYTTSVSGSGGIPTGVPTNGSTGPACEINDVTHVLNCFSPTAGGWYHIAFSAGAG